MAKAVRARQKERQERDPEYRARREAWNAERNRKNMERYYRNRVPIAELEEIAKTDSVAAEQLRIRREKQAEKNRIAIQRRKEKMAADPEYAALTLARHAESERKHAMKRKAALEDLKERAKTDPEAAAELEARREKCRKQTIRNREKKKARMEADPEYAAAERTLVREKARNAYYRRRSNSKAAGIARKETQNVCV